MAHQTTLSAAAAGTIDVGGDLTVNRLGFGAMRITGRGVWREPPDREQAKDLLRRVVALEINFIDTADSYGPHVSERLIAEALFPYPDDLVIATKGGLERPGPGEWVPNGRPDHLREACEGSLQRLRLDQIPVYQLHRPDPGVPLAESIGALLELRSEGKINHVGVSNVSEEQLWEVMQLTPVASVQNRYNLVDRTWDNLVDQCASFGLAFLPWAPIQDHHQVRAMADIADQRGVTPHQVALAWLLARSPAVLPIPGTGSIEHLEENVAAAAIELTDEEVAALNRAA